MFLKQRTVVRVTADCSLETNGSLLFIKTARIKKISQTKAIVYFLLASVMEPCLCSIWSVTAKQTITGLAAESRPLYKRPNK